MDEEILDPGPEHLIFIGRKKTPAVIFAVANQPGAAGPGSGREASDITITLTSNMIPKVNGDHRMNWRLLTDTLGLAVDDKNKRAFVKPTQAHGFVDEKGRRTPRIYDALAAGSCIRIQEKMDAATIQRLNRLSLVGAGLHSRDGYGRFKIDWDLHGQPSDQEQDHV